MNLRVWLIYVYTEAVSGSWSLANFQHVALSLVFPQCLLMLQEHNAFDCHAYSDCFCSGFVCFLRQDLCIVPAVMELSRSGLL